ncbi:MAG: endogenous inhibitor of DNA gyrase (YacG/DUF329 family) [bacterium]|jgi:endogenous inhibitor of DNA gyrase (YacG/DUF329 family)
MTSNSKKNKEENLESKKPLQVKCPTCSKKALWENNLYRPFCSKRCSLIDLGSWSDQSYSIKGESDFTKIQEE